MIHETLITIEVELERLRLQADLEINSVAAKPLQDKIKFLADSLIPQVEELRRDLLKAAKY